MAGIDLGSANIRVTADTSDAQSKLSSFAGSAAKLTTGAMAAATTAVAGLVASSVKAYAEYEQLVGGVDKIFEKSSKKVQEYAANAYKTANISANEYMNQVTSFSSSLLQGLDGDTKKTAEYADRAIRDMSDNANVFGTSIELIQNAYQGFAKQNYTMLDNLKLGYGGTKEEMARLIADASKMTDVQKELGLTVDASSMSFSNIINAISVMQKSMNIAGTTAKEAMSTIEGSFNSTKAAWANLMVGLADDGANFDELINNFVESASAFGDNVLPRISIAIEGVGKLISSLAPKIAEELPKLIQNTLPSLLNAGVSMINNLINGMMTALPSIINAGKDAIKTLIQGIQSNLPAIITGAMEIINCLIDGLIELFPMILDAGLQLIITLAQGIAQSIPELIPKIVECVVKMCDTIIENLPLFIDAAIQIIIAITEGLIQALPTLIEEVPRIINSFCDAINGQMGTIIGAGIKIIGMLIMGLIQAIPTLIANIPQIIMAIVNVWQMFNWAQLGKNAITFIKNGILNMKSSIGTAGTNIANGVKTAIQNIFSGGGTWGQNLVTNIKTGISSMASSLKTTASQLAQKAWDAIKTKFANAGELGKQLIDNIKKGISNTWASFTGWVKQKVDNIKLFSVDDLYPESEENQGVSFVTPEVNPMMRNGLFDDLSLFGATPKTTNTTSRSRDNESTKLFNTMIDKLDKVADLLENGNNKNISIEVPLAVNGREFARATAEYMETELNKRTVRNPRFAY